MNRVVYTALEIYGFARILMFRIIPYNDQALKSVVLRRKMAGFVEERPWGPRGSLFSFFGRFGSEVEYQLLRIS